MLYSGNAMKEQLLPTVMSCHRKPYTVAFRTRECLWCTSTKFEQDIWVEARISTKTPWTSISSCVPSCPCLLVLSKLNSQEFVLSSRWAVFFWLGAHLECTLNYITCSWIDVVAVKEIKEHLDTCSTCTFQFWCVNSFATYVEWQWEYFFCSPVKEHD